MKVAVFNTKSYDRQFLDAANSSHSHRLFYHEVHLNPATAVLAQGCTAACVFVNDNLGADTLVQLQQAGVSAIALRCAGFNNVDLAAAAACGIEVVRVPAYSPHAVAEHAIALILTLNRKTHRAHNRVREGNFALDGLLGFDLYGKTVGVVGTGKIGAVFARIMVGFGCRVIASDPVPESACAAMGIDYVELPDLIRSADIISLHCPLNRDSLHLIDDAAIDAMRAGVMLINTSRGALVDARALIRGLKNGKIGYVGLDVYEEEADIFFEDLSLTAIQDDVFARLLTFPNVLVTGHQGFFTDNALSNIAETTLANLTELELTGRCANAVVAEANRRD